MMNNPKCFFTADTHFGHSNIIKYCNRPFEHKHEHDEALIHNWNSVVQPKDTVYHLGDVGFGESEYLRKILARLHGTIYLIKGNHDGPAVKEPCSGRFGFIKESHIINQFTQEGEKIKVFLSHYPHRSWQHSFHGAYHLYGHVHGNLPDYGLSFDVGVDCWNYYPISFDQVHEKMKTLKIVTI